MPHWILVATYTLFVCAVIACDYSLSILKGFQVWIRPRKSEGSAIGPGCYASSLPLCSHGTASSMVLNVSVKLAGLLDDLQSRSLGSRCKFIPYSADNYFPFEKQLLAFYWVLVETKYLTMDHQVTLWPEIPIMKWVLPDPQNHKVGHA